MIAMLLLLLIMQMDTDDRYNECIANDEADNNTKIWRIKTTVFTIILLNKVSISFSQS